MLACKPHVLQLHWQWARDGRGVAHVGKTRAQVGTNFAMLSYARRCGHPGTVFAFLPVFPITVILVSFRATFQTADTVNWGVAAAYLIISAVSALSCLVLLGCSFLCQPASKHVLRTLALLSFWLTLASLFRGLVQTSMGCDGFWGPEAWISASATGFELVLLCYLRVVSALFKANPNAVLINLPTGTPSRAASVEPSTKPQPVVKKPFRLVHWCLVLVVSLLTIGAKLAEDKFGSQHKSCAL